MKKTKVKRLWPVTFEVYQSYCNWLIPETYFCGLRSKFCVERYCGKWKKLSEVKDAKW